MSITAKQISAALKDLAVPEIAEHSQRFFKTGKGEYGEGDKFLGIRVPIIRKVVRQHRDTSLGEILKLIKSKFHEERLCAVLLLVQKFNQSDEQTQAAVFDSYLGHTKFINNWDLVDSSASQIVGGFLMHCDRDVLYTLVQSPSLWERRISIIATLFFIKNHQFKDTLEISKQLVADKEDLIHKAVGWMLREVGKKDINVEMGFLKIHYLQMPRTMLRYAIEKFPEKERKLYLAGKI